MKTATADKKNRGFIEEEKSACVPGISWESIKNGIKNEIKRGKSLSREEETSLLQDIEKGIEAAALLERAVSEIEINLPALGEGVSASGRAELEDRKRRGESAKEQLIKKGFGQIVFCAEVMAMLAGVKDRSFGEEDLFQEACIGFAKALESFDRKRGNRLGTYARKAILRAMQRALDEKGCSIRVPTWCKDEAIKAKKTREQLEKELGRVPTDEEVAEGMGISVERLNKTERFSFVVESLEELQGEGKEAELFERGSADAAATPGAALEKREMRKAVRHLLLSLDRMTSLVVKRHIGIGCKPRSFREIGSEFGISREWARKIFERALKKLYPIAERRGLRAFLKSA